MERKQKLILVALALFVVIVVIVGWFTQKRNLPDGNIGGTPPQEVTGGNGTSSASQEQVSFYVSEVPKNAVLTTPETESPIFDATGKRTADLGQFSILAEASGYTPATLTVKAGNVMRLAFSSRGGNYDLYFPYIGVYLAAKDGETSHVSFVANPPGTLVFECRDLCPSLGKIGGQLIVLP